MTRRGVLATVGMAVLVPASFLRLARFSESPADFFPTTGLVVAFIALVVLICALIGTRTVRLARELRETRPDATVFHSLKNEALTKGLEGMGYRDELLAGMTPENFPVSVVCSLEQDGLRLWSGTRDSPRLLLAVPWRDCTGLERDLRFSDGDRYRKVLLVSTAGATLVLPMVGGPFAVRTAPASVVNAVFRDASEKWRRREDSRPMVSANSAAFRYLWSRLVPASGGAIPEEDLFDETVLLLDALADTPHVHGVPAMLDQESGPDGQLVTLDISHEDLLGILTETHSLQR